jgi:hypothetical protein
MSSFVPVYYGKQELANYTNKARTTLMVKKNAYFSLNGTTFDNNFVIDDIDLENVDSFFYHQSHSFLLIDFAGNFSSVNSASFRNNKGAAGGPLMSTLL